MCSSFPRRWQLTVTHFTRHIHWPHVLYGCHLNRDYLVGKLLSSEAWLVPPSGHCFLLRSCQKVLNYIKTFLSVNVDDCARERGREKGEEVALNYFQYSTFAEIVTSFRELSKDLRKSDWTAEWSSVLGVSTVVFKSQELVVLFDKVVLSQALFGLI